MPNERVLKVLMSSMNPAQWRDRVNDTALRTLLATKLGRPTPRSLECEESLASEEVWRELVPGVAVGTMTASNVTGVGAGDQVQ